MDRREATWTGRDVIIAAGVGGGILLVLAFALTRGPLRRRSRCREYEARFREEVESGRLRSAGITEEFARREGCTWLGDET